MGTSLSLMSVPDGGPDGAGADSAMDSELDRELAALDTLGFLVARPWLCVLVSHAGLLFQLLCPLAVLGPTWSVAFFVLATCFHAGAFATQGIDFLSQWLPALLIFAVDRRAVTVSRLLPQDPAGDPLEVLCWALAALHLGSQLFCAGSFRELHGASGSSWKLLGAPGSFCGLLSFREVLGASGRATGSFLELVGVPGSFWVFLRSSGSL